MIGIASDAVPQGFKVMPIGNASDVSGRGRDYVSLAARQQITGLTDALELRLREITADTRVDRDLDCINGDVGL